VAFLGKNGCGKTSLLNILVGDESPTKGAVNRHLGCRVQMLQQHHYKGEQLDPSLCALDHIRRLPQDESSAVGQHDPGTRQEEAAQRSYLANFGIRGGRALIPVKYLSGGQRMRVAMALSLFRRPDVLILDEVRRSSPALSCACSLSSRSPSLFSHPASDPLPHSKKQPTNHLDHATVKALCDALETYEGAVIAVSHDESFVNRVIARATVATDRKGAELKGELWVMSRRRLTRFDGSFSAYKAKIRSRVEAGANHNEI